MIEAESHSLLYVIISIILLIISAIGKNKNKQAAPSPSSETNPAPPVTWQQELEEVFGKMAGEVMPPEKTEPIKEIQEFEKAPAQSVFAEIRPVESTFEERTAMPVQNITTNMVMPGYAQQNEDISVRLPELDENEMRKAIIYSEIINRKYF